MRLVPSPETMSVREWVSGQREETGKFVVIEIKWRGVGTATVRRRLSRHLGIPPLQIGIAHSWPKPLEVTQWISVPCRLQNQTVTFLRSSGLQVLSYRLSEHPLEMNMGTYVSYRFQVGLGPMEGLEDIEKTLEPLLNEGFFNHPPPIIWKSGERHQAKRALLRGHTISHENPESTLRLRFELFDSWVQKREKEPSPKRPLVGDFLLSREGGLPWKLQEDPAFELVENCRNGNLSPCGPLFGHHPQNTSGRPLEIEDQLLKENALTRDDLASFSDPEIRLPLFALIREVQVQRLGKRRAIIKFNLPSGVFGFMSPAYMPGIEFDSKAF